MRAKALAKVYLLHSFLERRDSVWLPRKDKVHFYAYATLALLLSVCMCKSVSLEVEHLSAVVAILTMSLVLCSGRGMLKVVYSEPEMYLLEVSNDRGMVCDIMLLKLIALGLYALPNSFVIVSPFVQDIAGIALGGILLFCLKLLVLTTMTLVSLLNVAHPLRILAFKICACLMVLGFHYGWGVSETSLWNLLSSTIANASTPTILGATGLMAALLAGISCLAKAIVPRSVDYERLFIALNRPDLEKGGIFLEVYTKLRFMRGVKRVIASEGYVALVAEGGLFKFFLEDLISVLIIVAVPAITFGLSKGLILFAILAIPWVSVKKVNSVLVPMVVDRLWIYRFAGVSLGSILESIAVSSMLYSLLFEAAAVATLSVPLALYPVASIYELLSALVGSLVVLPSVALLNSLSDVLFISKIGKTEKLYSIFVTEVLSPLITILLVVGPAELSFISKSLNLAHFLAYTLLLNAAVLLTIRRLADDIFSA